MNLATAKVARDILVAMKINKVRDKDAKLALTRDFVAIRKAVKSVEDDHKAIADKFRSDWEDELRRKERSYECIKAEAEANEAIREVYDREAEIGVEKVPSELLYDPELWGEEDTLGQIANSVDFLVEAGVAE